MTDTATEAPPAFDFQTEADRLILASRLVAETDPGRLLDEISRAHTLGPILDPTAYKGALDRGDLDRLTRLARAAVELQRAFREVANELETP